MMMNRQPSSSTNKDQLTTPNQSTNAPYYGNVPYPNSAFPSLPTPMSSVPSTTGYPYYGGYYPPGTSMNYYPTMTTIPSTGQVNVVQKEPVSYASAAKMGASGSNAPPWHKKATALGLPSYTKVTAVPSTVTPTAMTATSTQTNPTTNPSAPAQWPEPLKSFVTKCFDSCGNSDDLKTQMEKLLKDLILKKIETHELHTFNWFICPVPRLPGMEENNLVKVETQTAKGMEKKKKKELQVLVNNEEIKRRQERAKRFQELAEIKETGSNLSISSSNFLLGETSAVVIGTCTHLEKNYFRLTSAPDPSTIRPLSVLIQSLEYILSKGKGDYGYLNDQLKAIRQDLVIQRIRNPFTIKVYEIHGRLALEKNDLSEFNQCQTQLSSLYNELLASHQRDLLQVEVNGVITHPIEFLAYRILYFIHTANYSDLNVTIRSLTPVQRSMQLIKLALRIKETLYPIANYNLFFKLWRTINTDTKGQFYMIKYFLINFVEKERLKALKSICSAYRPSLSLDYLQILLAFSNMSELKQLLVEEYGLVLTDNGNELDTKSSLKNIMDLVNEKVFKIDIKGQI